jgi:hypothetical protein
MLWLCVWRETFFSIFWKQNGILINFSELHKPVAANLLFCLKLTLVPLAVSSADKNIFFLMLHKNSKPRDRHKLQTSGGKLIDMPSLLWLT